MSGLDPAADSNKPIKPAKAVWVKWTRLYASIAVLHSFQLEIFSFNPAP
jgi:hypothetical protein